MWTGKREKLHQNGVEILQSVIFFFGGGAQNLVSGSAGLPAAPTPAVLAMSTLVIRLGIPTTPCTA